MMMGCLMLVVSCLIHSPVDDDGLSHAGCQLIHSPLDDDGLSHAGCLLSDTQSS